jgi:hypothetical protein
MAGRKGIHQVTGFLQEAYRKTCRDRKGFNSGQKPVSASDKMTRPALDAAVTGRISLAADGIKPYDHGAAGSPEHFDSVGCDKTVEADRPDAIIGTIPVPDGDQHNLAPFPSL